MSKELKEGSQESRASNGAQFGVETKKLWSFEDKRAKLSGNFAADTPFGRVFRSCETNFWHTSAICSIVPFISKLRYGCEITFELRNQFWAAKSLLSFEMIAKWSPNFEMVAKSPPRFKMAFKLRNWLAKWRKVCKNTLQSQGKLLKYQQSPTPCIWRGEPCTPWDHTH